MACQLLAKVYSKVVWLKDHVIACAVCFLPVAALRGLPSKHLLWLQASPGASTSDIQELASLGNHGQNPTTLPTNCNPSTVKALT